ncbi:MAG: beta-ketoacyl synthase [Gammaproteobacteria bacterium]|nr:beta-ketoacyl synthase [Gammaproteobacteria bacterium]
MNTAHFPAHIRGLSHISACGLSLRDAVCTVQNQQAPHIVSHRLPPPLDYDAPYYAINYVNADWQQRKNYLLTQCLTECAISSGLSIDALRTHTILLASSALNVGAGEQNFPHLQTLNLSSIANDLCTLLDWQGPALTISTACTSSLNALLFAQRLIASGGAEHVTIIGLDLFNRTALAGFGGMGLLSANNMKPFDQQRDGMVLGEAVAGIVLSRHPHPNKPSCLLLGGAQFLDKAHQTGLKEDGSSVITLLQQCLANSGLQSSDITYIKAQASGSALNDLAEAQGLAMLFDTNTKIASLKAYLGHCLGASGLAELTLLLGCAEAGFLPGTRGLQHADPLLPLQPLREHFLLENQTHHLLCNILGFGGSLSSIAVRIGPKQ